ncbi:MAG: hypothetical protein AAFV25_07250 [Bacteroidota bacterium]
MFFLLSLGLIVFFFLARVFVVALLAAAVMTGIYWLFSKLRSVFWHGQRNDEWEHARFHRGLGRGQVEPLFYERRRPHRPSANRFEDVHYIHVH